MLRNYLSVALRHLRKRKFYTAVNIVGLAVGMSCCLLISAYVLDELSYDTFHEKAERIYRITTQLDLNGQRYDVAASNEEMAEVLSTALPEAEKVVRIDAWQPVSVKYEEQLFLERRILAVDSAFFEVFSFRLQEGNPDDALHHPQSVVLTQTTAHKYFGKQSDLLGETLLIDKQPYTVTGIAEDPPANSHFHFDFLIPFRYQPSPFPSWANLANVRTYLLLADHIDPAPLSEKLHALYKKHDTAQYEELQRMGGKVAFPVQPLLDIHLHSQRMNEFEPNGNITYVYTFAAIALLIILLACINFINLSTARSAERAKEVGIRKTVGSSRAALIGHFLTESIVISITAMLLALGLAELLRYPFSEVAGKTLDLHLLDDARVWLIITGIVLLTGLVAGWYPAWYLTKFEPVRVLKGSFVSGGQRPRFRNVLVIFQYSVSISLVICTLLVYRQLQYMQNINLGLHKENVLVLPNSVDLGTNFQPFLSALKDQSYVTAVAASRQNPFAIDNASDARKKGDAPGQSMMLISQVVTYDYLKTLGIQLKAGRNFSQDIASDTTALILNQAAVRALGLEKPLDAIIDCDEEFDYHVIGVAEKFHFGSLHEEIAPFAFMLQREQPLSTIEVRISPENTIAKVGAIEKLWQTYAPDLPFTYSFLDEDYDALFREEQRLGRLFTGFTILALLVASLGLFALATFMAERRAKEIGIRKVLGASVTTIVTMLSRDFIKLIIIALLIAVPIGYYAMQMWLQDFAYRTDISFGVFVVAGASTLIITLLTVSFQAIKAAIANPVDSLRNE